jgi:hypothetical protein
MRPTLVLVLMLGAASLHGQEPVRSPGGSLFIGPSIMFDRLTNHFDRRPRAIGLEGDYVLYRGAGTRGPTIAVIARAHYYDNGSIVGDVPVYRVTSLAAGLAYHPIPDRRLDPYVGVALRYRRRTRSQADSTTVDPLLDVGARWRLGRRTSLQTGMSFAGLSSFGLWRIALMFNY